MSKPRVLLICSQHLFGESVETILRSKDDVELVGPLGLNNPDLHRQLLAAQPSVVVIADENLQSEAAAELTKRIIEWYPDLSVIRTGLSENVFRVFSTHTEPAGSGNLFDAIYDCTIRNRKTNEPDILTSEIDKSHPTPTTSDGSLPNP